MSRERLARRAAGFSTAVLVGVVVIAALKPVAGESIPALAGVGVFAVVVAELAYEAWGFSLSGWEA